MPAGFPLAARDRFDQPIAAGDVVRILTVTSCLKGLPEEDKVLLRTIVGETREIGHIDPHGYVWLSFGGAGFNADFSLFPGEVTRSLSWSGKKA
jgi:hypothetical protein